jgi:hypothetical protein
MLETRLCGLVTNHPLGMRPLPQKVAPQEKCSILCWRTIRSYLVGELDALVVIQIRRIHVVARTTTRVLEALEVSAREII